jgi:hypothetical protein
MIGHAPPPVEARGTSLETKAPDGSGFEARKLAPQPPGAAAIRRGRTIALAVGVLAGGEAVAPVAVGGVVLVLAAAYLVQRPERPDIPAARSG